jgi:FlaG/FlaF family flagellin (archaellin)
MEFLTNLFGNLTSGIIRLAVTVGILAAVYFFIVRPVLDTTNHAVDSANKQFEKSFDNSFESPTVNTKAIEAKVNKTIEDVNRQVQVEVHRSFHTAKVHGNPEKLLRCIEKANGNVHRIERCSTRYS